MPTCCVKSCQNRAGFVKQKGISFHSIPAKRLHEWLSILKISPGDYNSSCRVCSIHFEEHCMNRTLGQSRLKENATPTLHLINDEDAENINIQNISEVPPLKVQKVYFQLSTGTLALPEENINTQNTSVVPAPKVRKVDVQVPSSSFTDAHSRTLANKSFKELFGSPRLANICSETSSSMQVTNITASPTYKPSPSTSSSSSTKVRRQQKLISSIHSYAVSPGRYKRMYIQSKSQTRRTRQYLSRAKNVIKSYKKRVTSLRAVVQDLKKQSLVSDGAIQQLENSFCEVPSALMKRLICNTTNKSLTRAKYPPVLRQFALTLQFYSCKAYEYVRKVFQLALPAQTAIRTWYSSIECGPGFCQPSFELLERKVAEAKEKGKSVICSLMMDEMAIKRKIEMVGTKVWGYVDLGLEIDNEQAPATEALVIMVTSHNDQWKIPIGYFFIQSLTGKEKANMISECLIRLMTIGIEVTSVTCDGPNANFAMLTELGCSVRNVHNLKVWFPHPSNQEIKVFVILDACHMLKLVRNCLATLKTLKDPNGQAICWKYIEDLQKLQQEDGLRLANKLKSVHMDWTRQKMKVNLAAQTLSQSVADALTFMCTDMKANDFVGAEATIKFITVINNAFDILNSRSPFAPGLKAPMKDSNIEEITQELLSTVEYLSKCTDETGRFLWQTTRKTPFIGFIINIYSVLGMYEEFVSTKKLPHLLTYKCSQDHLELFFCAIRSRNGWNNNPSSFQFMISFKRLLMHNAVRGTGGNCQPLDLTSMLFCTGKSSIEKAAQPIDAFVIKKYGLDIEETIIEEHDYDVLPLHISISECMDNVTAYMAGYVVKMCMKKIKCNTCVDALKDKDKCSVGQQHLQLILRKDRGGLIVPSQDLRHICQYCEFQIRKVMKFTDNKVPAEASFIATFVLVLTNNLLKHNLFSSLSHHNYETFPGEENHTTILIKTILFSFMKIRFHNLAKTYTENIQGSIVRKMLNKLILFNHQ